MNPLAVVLFLTGLTATVGAHTLNEKVVGVMDGDSLTVIIDNKKIEIRLTEIDLPEKSQAFGRRATQALARLTFQKDARFVVIDSDRYGRTLGRVYVRNVYHTNAGEMDVNAEMVRQGYAWAYRKYLRDREILELEVEARRAGRGLWADARPVPPWEWRRCIRSG